MEDDDRTAAARVWFYRIWTTVGVLVLLVAAWLVLREPLRIVFAPLGLAAVIVYLLNPGVRGLQARGVPRAVGAALSYVVLAGAAVGIGFAVGPLVLEQGRQFLDGVPEIAADVQDAVNQQLARLGSETRFDFDPESIQESLTGFFENNREQVQALVRGAGSFVGAVLHLIVTLVLAPFLAFYLLVDLPRITRGIKRLLPPGPRGEVVHVASRIGGTVGAYFRGQLLVATFVAVATSIGLVIIGLPFWALVGSLTGLFNLIPLIGPFIGGLIGVIVALTVGDGLGQAVAVVVVMTAVQQVDNHVITPNIISRTVKVHPVTVILGLLVAGTLYGLLGMVLAVPVIATAKLIFLHLVVTRVPSMRHLAAEGPGLFGIELPEIPGAPSASEAEAARPSDLRPDPPLRERLLHRVHSDRTGRDGEAPGEGPGDTGEPAPTADREDADPQRSAAAGPDRPPPGD